MSTELKERLVALADDSLQPLRTDPEELLHRARAVRARRRWAGAAGTAVLVASIAAMVVVVPHLVPGSGHRTGPAGSRQDLHADAVRLQQNLMRDRPAIGIVPKPGRLGLVGMPAWMWLEPGKFASASLREAAAAQHGRKIVVTARLTGVDWDMGDGTVVHCRTAGTPYQSSFGVKRSPDCGHTYRNPGSYKVTATSRWRVTWRTRGGQHGTLPQPPLNSTVTVRFSRMNVLTQG